MKNKKKLIPVIIILILGIGTMIGSYWYMNYSEVEEMKPIVTINKDMNPYEFINSSNLSYSNVPVSFNTDGYYESKDDAIGKVAVHPLSRGDKLKEGDLTSAAAIKDWVFLTLKTDYTRTGGAVVGSIVDVYHVYQIKKDGEIVEEREKIASDVVILDITNSNGVSINSSEDSITTIPGSTKSIPIEAVKIAVNGSKYDISKFVSGSIQDNNGYVLILTSNDNPIKTQK